MRQGTVTIAPFCALLIGACGAGAGAGPKPSAAPALAAENQAPVRWQAQLDRDHPLVGRIVGAGGADVGEADVRERMHAARFVLIGEQHDNPDHHLLQARLLRALVASGRKPAVVFEMIDQALQPAVDRALAAHLDVDAFGEAIDWAHSGWPEWSLYRPLFAEVLRAQLPIVAAGIERKATMRIATEGEAALDPELARALAAAGPLAPEQLAALRAEMRQAHCGMLPEAMLDGMVLIQRVRDARLALAMQQAGADGALLIAGAGHVRKDRGVPAYLARARAGAALAIGLLEVQHGSDQPRDYDAGLAGGEAVFDLVWFTPRASDEDRCAELRARSAPAAPAGSP